MTKEEQFIQAIRGNVLVKKTFPNAFQAKIKSIDGFKCTVTVTNNDMDLEDVLLTSTEDNDKGFVLIPKIGTNAIVGLIGDDENSLYLITVDEIDAVKIIIDNQELIVDNTGLNLSMTTGKLTLKNNISSVKGLLQDIVSMVKQITVSTGVGPSGTPLPPTIAQANIIEQNINALFN